jgi:CheY-like chemotaxis protein
MEAVALKKILLADDDADDRRLFKEALATVSPESKLAEVKDGAELIEKLAKEKPDLLFLDINMPLKNGIECVKWIKEVKQLRRVPIIAYSSAFDTTEINKAYAYGMDLYFIKPTKRPYLLEDLERLFALNWNDPQTITSNHFICNHYIAFNCNRA